MKNNRKSKLDICIVIVDWTRLFVFALFLAYCIPTFFFRPERVIGTSMYPTLENEERVISNVISPILFGIDRFDVVIVKDEASGDQWVKRVVGLPNEQISYKDGILYINDEMVKEPFLDEAYMIREGYTKETFTADQEVITLQEDEYFLVGDNRMNSLDSRVRGPFHRKDIIAKDAYVFWPLKNVRMVTNGNQ